MKKHLILAIAFCLASLFAFAQSVPQGINYQAVARDSKGAPLSLQDIGLRVSLRAGDATGKTVYEELHQLKTNELGMFQLVIGQGNAEQGDFQQVPWSEFPVWMVLAIDETGKGEFVTLAATQLMAVPYAFHAGTAASWSAPMTELEKNRRCGSTGIPFWSNLGNYNVSDTCHFIGTTVPVDFIFKTNNVERMRITKNGELIIIARVTFEDNVQFSGDSVIIDNDLFVRGNVDVGQDLAVHGNAGVDQNLEVGGNTGIGQDLGVGGNGSVAGDLEVGGDGRFTNIFVTNNASIGNDLDLGRDGSVGRDLSVARNTTIGGTLTSSGKLTVNNVSDLNGQVTIKANVGGGDASYNAYPLRVEGSAQGIAVKVNAGTPDGNNNFITFFDNNNTARGRIEGQTSAEVASSPEYIFETSIYTAEVIAAGVNIGLSALPNACAGVGAVACPPEPSVVAIAIAEEVLAAANLAAYQAFAFENVGVTYQSGSADYAEWLKRSDAGETMTPGDIVGVKGGLISKRTDGGVSQYLVISTNPAVLGNMPTATEQSLYEKVAFMGQIPVKVRGQVHIGDFILPSGFNDGTGIAVSPQRITPGQYRQIVGVAWSATPAGSKLAYINMAIGLNNNDIARLVEEQQSEIDRLNQEVAALKNDFSALSQRLAALESGKPIAPVPAIPQQATRNDFLAASIPVNIDAAQVEEAILLLQDTYRARGYDIEQHAGLKKLFSDQTFRQEIIRNVQANYAATRDNILKMETSRK